LLAISGAAAVVLAAVVAFIAAVVLAAAVVLVAAVGFNTGAVVHNIVVEVFSVIAVVLNTVIRFP
jgi:hypothetical protein